MVQKRRIVDLSEMQDLSENLTWKQVKQLLRKYHIPAISFRRWINGQTSPIIEYDDKTVEVGYFKWDVERFLMIKLRGGPDIWD